jgi:hypothetical protein
MTFTPGQQKRFFVSPSFPTSEVALMMNFDRTIFLITAPLPAKPTQLSPEEPDSESSWLLC